MESGDLREDGAAAVGAPFDTVSELRDTATAEVPRAVRGAGRRRVSDGRLMTGLVVWDALVPVALLCLAALAGGVFGPEINGGPAYPTDYLAVVLAIASPVALAATGAYDNRRRRNGSRLSFAVRLLTVGVVLSWASMMISSAAGWPIDFPQMLVLAVLLPVGWLVGRWACDRHPATTNERVLLVGAGDAADRVRALTERNPRKRLRVVGRVDERDGDDAPGSPPLLGGYARIPEIISEHVIDRVIVAFTPEPDSRLVETLRACVAEGVQVDVVPRFYDLVGPTPRANPLGRIALVEVPGRGLTQGQRAVKRAFDIAGSGLLLLVLSPVIVASLLAILISDGRPVLFTQPREGRGGRPFRIVKLRTMREGSEPSALVGDEHGENDPAALIDAHKRSSVGSVTRVGHMLRSTSLDELPQLWNVLVGDMSLVGPRPLPLYESAHLAGWHVARQDLKPGLTGLWQVSGRSGIDWDERMHLDYTYVSHWSLASDIRILLRTLPAVLRKEGAL